MKRYLYVLLAGSLLLCGCTGQYRSRHFNMWANYDVTMYGIDGKVINHWVTSGKVYSEDGSDGWFFTDSTTGKLMCVSGFVVIKQL